MGNKNLSFRILYTTSCKKVLSKLQLSVTLSLSLLLVTYLVEYKFLLSQHGITCSIFTKPQEQANSYFWQFEVSNFSPKPKQLEL